MATIEELMRANLLEVFNERDARRRDEAIARTYTTDVSFSDPEETVSGFEALSVKAQKILDEAPDFTFTTGGPIRVVQDLGFLEWNFGPEGHPPVVTGADVALIVDGKIAKVWTMLLSGV